MPLRILTTFLCAGATFLLATSTFAQTSLHLAPTEPFVLKSDKDLDTSTIKLGISPVPSILSDHENYFVEVVGRSKSGEPEYHTHWIDYIVVQHGEALLIYGGDNPGATDNGKGELHGGAIVGGSTVELRPGDYAQIPAGTWHQINLKPNAPSFRYVVVKVRQ